MNVFQATKETELVSNVFVYYIDEAAAKIKELDELRKKYDFANVDAAGFTKLQDFLDFFNDVYQLNSEYVEQIGLNFMEDYDYPDDVFNFSTALQHLEVFYSVYQFDSENQNPTGDLVFGIVSRSVYRIIIRSPFPCDFEVGLLKGVAKSFKKHIKVEHHDFQCRMGMKSEVCDYFVIVIA
jgi:hypothetical protein